MAALERIAAIGWPGTETVALGDWWLRAGHGFTGRANSALPVGNPGCPLDDALAAVDAFYSDRGLPPQLQVPEPRVDGGQASVDPGAEARDLAELQRRLDERGWVIANAAWVLTAPLSTLLTACPEDPRLPAVRLDRTPSAGWLASYHYRGDPLPADAVQVLTAGASPIFASAGPAGSLCGVARGSVSGGWLGITAVTVAETFRRRGVARSLMGALARWAADRAAEQVYLQVDLANQGALTMYDRLGFIPHHRYHYRRPAGVG